MESAIPLPKLNESEYSGLGSSIQIKLSEIAPLLAVVERLIEHSAATGTLDPDLAITYRQTMMALGLPNKPDWQEWSRVNAACAKIGEDILDRVVQSRLEEWEKNRTKAEWQQSSRVMFLLRAWRNATFQSPDPERDCDTVNAHTFAKALLRECGVEVGRYRGDWQYAFPLGGERSETARHWKVHNEPGKVDENGRPILDENGDEIGYEIEMPLTEVMPYAEAVRRGLLADGDKPAVELGGHARIVTVQVGTEKRWVGPPRPDTEQPKT